MSSQAPTARRSWRDIAKIGIPSRIRGARNKYSNSVLAIVDVCWPRSHQTAKGTFETTTIVARPIGTMPDEPLKCTVQEAAKALVEAADPPLPMTHALVAGQREMFKLNGTMLTLAAGTLIEMTSIHVNYSYGKNDHAVHKNIEIGTVTVQKCITPDGVLHHVLTQGKREWPLLAIETDLDGMAEIPKAEKYGKRLYMLQHNPTLTDDDKEALFAQPRGQFTTLMPFNAKEQEVFIRGTLAPTGDDRKLALGVTFTVLQWRNGGEGGYDAAPAEDAQTYVVSPMLWPEQLAVLRIKDPVAWHAVASWVLPATPFSLLASENRIDTREMPFYTEPDNEAAHPEGVTHMMVTQVNALALDVAHAYLTLGVPLDHAGMVALLKRQNVDSVNNKWHPVTGGLMPMPATVVGEPIINLTESNISLASLREGYTFVALPHIGTGSARLVRAYLAANKADLRCLFDDAFMQRYRDAMGNADFDEVAATLQQFVADEGMTLDKRLFAVLRELDDHLPRFSVFAVADVNVRHKASAGSKAIGKLLDNLVPAPAGVTAAMRASFEAQAAATDTTLLVDGKRRAPADGDAEADSDADSKRPRLSSDESV